MKIFIIKNRLRNRFIFFLLLFFVISLNSAFAQDFSPNLVYPGIYKKRTVYNLRIRENNSYKGAFYREIRERYSLVSDIGAEKEFSGNTYIFEELKHEGRDIARKVDTIIEGNFIIKPEGEIERDRDSIFPLMAGFPVYPEHETLKPGDVWVASGDIMVDPLKKDKYTKINFICEYKYTGITQYKGIDVYAINAQYALRYKRGEDPFGDPDLEAVSGSHKITFYLTKKDALPFFIQDNIDELYTYPGMVVSSKGFSHTWYTDVIPLQREKVKKDVMQSIVNSNLDSKDYEVTEKAEGISVTLNSLHFAADQAVLLPGEDQKVKAIANILKTIPDRTFMVVGHTADIGHYANQQKLSVERAQEIADLLKQSGIAPDRILFTGKGGTEPVGDNRTDEGKAKNRRVEIIIMED